jgi:hypothetical protein
MTRFYFDELFSMNYHKVFDELFFRANVGSPFLNYKIQYSSILYHLRWDIFFRCQNSESLGVVDISYVFVQKVCMI